MVIIQPEFEIDEKNRVICKFHHNYLQFIDPNKDYFQDQYLEKKITCLTCSHYDLNECYFNKSRIDEIEYKRQKKKDYKCKLCGNKIERLLTIIYKLFNIEIYGIEIPLFCCSCYEKLKMNEFIVESKKVILVYLFIIITSVFSLFYFGFFLSILNLQPYIGILIYIPYYILIMVIIIKTFKKLSKILYGMRYYKKNLAKTIN